MKATLTSDQDAAIDAFLNFISDPHEREMVLEGYPGCGKSFVTKHMIYALEKSNQVITMLGSRADQVVPYFTATTNKAAKVLGDFVNAESSTIHSLLGLQVRNDHKTGESKLVPIGEKKIQKYEKALIIVDEASYIDPFLLKLIRESTFDCKILYIGDRYQLANVKCSKPPVFYEIPNKATLTTSKRFGENSNIAKLGQQLRDTIDTGKWKPIEASGTDILRVEPLVFKSMLENEFTSLQHNVNNAKILGWTNKRVQAYNNFIRQQFTNKVAFEDGETVVVANTFIRKFGDKKKETIPTEALLQVVGTPYEESVRFGSKADFQWDLECYRTSFKGLGSYYVPKHYVAYYNLLKQLSNQAKRVGSWSEFFKAKEQIMDVRPAFASTVYKAQGSTYKKVFIDLDDIGNCRQSEQVARMLHVAITRASDQVILRGNLPARYGG